MTSREKSVKLTSILREVYSSNGEKGIHELQKIFPNSKIIWTNNHEITVFWSRGQEGRRLPWQLKMMAGYVKLIDTDEVLKDRFNFSIPIQVDQDTLDQIEMIKVMTT